MWRVILIGFLILHGLVHLGIWAAPVPRDGNVPFRVADSWLIGDQRAIALLMAVVAAVLLIGAGGGLWAHAAWWRSGAAFGLVMSFALMVLFFHPWFLFIQVVNVGLIVAVVWLDWPTRAMAVD